MIYKFIKILIPVSIKKYIKSSIKQLKNISHEDYMKYTDSYYSKFIETDSLNYEILVNGIYKIKNIPGIVCEIGTRRGGSAKWIIDSLVENKDLDRTFITIDPYGNIEYNHGDGDIGTNKTIVDYTNKMRNETIPYLYIYALNKLKNFIFFNLEDSEFFERYKNGIPIYSEGGKNLVNQYSFVFFDGPHDYESIYKEVEFFNSRTHKGSVYIFDDVANYNHRLLENELLFKNNWKLYESSQRKISYVKIN